MSSLRAVWRARHPHRPGQLFRRCFRHRGQVRRRPSQSQRVGLAMFGMFVRSSVANAVTVGSPHHSRHDQGGVPASFRWRRRGCSVHWWPDHAADHGRRCFLMIEFWRCLTQPSSSPQLRPPYALLWRVLAGPLGKPSASGLRGLTAEGVTQRERQLPQALANPDSAGAAGWYADERFYLYVSAFAGITSCIIVGLTTSERGNTAQGIGIMLALHAVLAVIISVNLKTTAWRCSRRRR